MVGGFFRHGFSHRPHVREIVVKKLESIVCSCALFVVIAGCGGGETAKPVSANEAAFKGSSDDDKAKVAEHLKKAGIEGEIVGLVTGKDMWQVDVGNKVTPGKRANPTPPRVYTVNKATGEVKKEM